MIKIPLRPDDKSACEELQENEMDALTYYVISGCTKEYAQEHFILSDYRVSKAALVRVSNQFFGSEKARKYIASYRQTLNDFFDGLKGTHKEEEEGEEEVKKDSKVEISVDATKKKRIAAVQKIIDYIISEAEHINTLEDPETLVKIADKVGLFDDFEKTAEAPRRYLPVDRCGDCRYYQFCTSDKVIDECKRCRYKHYAEENGVYYDHKNMLGDIEKLEQ